MGPDPRKWHQTDREGISYHYHSKLGEVLAVPWRRVPKRKFQGLHLLALDSCNFTKMLQRLWHVGPVT